VKNIRINPFNGKVPFETLIRLGGCEMQFDGGTLALDGRDNAAKQVSFRLPTEMAFIG
jgi:hypothetical protein